MTDARFKPFQPTPSPAPESDYRAERPCPICGSTDSRSVLHMSDFQFFSDAPDLCKRADIHHVQCRQCFALFMNPCYTETGFRVLFAEAGMTYGSSGMRQSEQMSWLGERGLLRDGFTYLDVGCASGSFIAALPAEVNAVGVDIDADAVARAKERLGGKTRRFVTADFEKLTWNEPVDVITMFHVLEHLPKPITVLERLRALASTGTRLVVEVPLLEKGKTNDINGFLTPSHLTHFSRTSLTMCLHRSGWRLVDATDQPDYNGYRVLAEPAEPNATDRPCQDDIATLYDYLADWYANLHRCAQRLVQQLDAEYLVIRGGGMHTEFIYQLLPLFHMEHSGTKARGYAILDGDPKKQGRHWRGIPILSPACIADFDWGSTQMLISSYGHQEAMIEEALAAGVPRDRIIALYDFIRRY